MSCPSISNSSHLQTIPPCSTSYQKMRASVSTTNSWYNHNISILHTFSSRAHNAFPSSVQVPLPRATRLKQSSVSKSQHNDKAGGDTWKTWPWPCCASRSPSWACGLSPAAGQAALKCHLLKSSMVKRGRLPAQKMSPYKNPKAPAANFAFVPCLLLLRQVGNGPARGQLLGQGASLGVVGILGHGCHGTRLWGNINRNNTVREQPKTWHFWQGKRKGASSVLAK